MWFEQKTNFLFFLFKKNTRVGEVFILQHCAVLQPSDEMVNIVRYILTCCSDTQAHSLYNFIFRIGCLRFSAQFCLWRCWPE